MNERRYREKKVTQPERKKIDIFRAKKPNQL
jgi:hypothetical protein